MHVSFIPYGKRECVERFIRDMEAQKHPFRMYKDDKIKTVFIDGQVRVCPLGVYEYVFPKEDIDIVLATLDFGKKIPYGVGKGIKLLRRLLRYKKAPLYSDDKTYLWNRNHVSILPIGIREDKELTGNLPEDDGWTHEAI